MLWPRKTVPKGSTCCILLPVAWHAGYWICATTSLYHILDIHLRDTTNTQRQTSDAGTSLQDCFTTVEWGAKCQVRSLSRYLPLQVSRCIVRSWFVGNEGYGRHCGEFVSSCGARSGGQEIQDRCSCCWKNKAFSVSLGGGRRSVGGSMALFSIPATSRPFPQQLSAAPKAIHLSVWPSPTSCQTAIYPKSSLPGCLQPRDSRSCSALKLSRKMTLSRGMAETVLTPSCIQALSYPGMRCKDQ
jgi:hypothetical protein